MVTRNLLICFIVYFFSQTSCNRGNCILDDVKYFDVSEKKPLFYFIKVDQEDVLNLVFDTGITTDTINLVLDDACNLVQYSNNRRQTLIGNDLKKGDQFQFNIISSGEDIEIRFKVEDLITDNETTYFILNVSDFYTYDNIQHDVVIFYSNRNGFIGSYIKDPGGKYIISERGNILRSILPYNGLERRLLM